MIEQPRVPTNIKDLDSYIVDKLVARREEYAAEGITDYQPNISMLAYNAIFDFILDACDSQHAERQMGGGDELTMLVDEVSQDYAYAFNSGPQRRSILYKMAADAREIISKRPKRKETPAAADKFMKINEDITLSEQDFISLNSFLGSFKSYVGTGPTPYNKGGIFKVPSKPYQDYYDRRKRS